MENKQNIIGVYRYKINIPTMFHNYEMYIKNHNLITYIGEDYFIERWINNDYGLINKILLGKQGITPSKSKKTIDNATEITDITLSNRKTSLLITTEVKGTDVNDVNEIGVMTTDERLISHDVHSRIVVPESSTINIDYQYILTNGAYENNWERYSPDKDIYKVNVLEEVSYVIEEDTNKGYTKVESIEDLTNGTYCQIIDGDIIILYIITSDNTNPLINHTILVNYKE